MARAGCGDGCCCAGAPADRQRTETRKKTAQRGTLVMTTSAVMSVDLLRAPPVALRDHRDAVHLGCIGHFLAIRILGAAGKNIERPLVLASERQADDTARRRN